jgi:3-deoxy-7-phosphoheptulonate synthase
MIVAMQDRATDEQIQHVIERMVELGFNVHRTTGEVQTILAGVGTPSHFEVTEFQVLPGVHQAYRISSPYKLAGRGFRPEGTRVTFPNGLVVGGDEIIIMAGPCSVESRARSWWPPLAHSFCAVARSSRAARRTASRAWVSRA